MRRATSCRDGKECPGIVVETYCIVKAGRLRSLLPETHHSLRTVMKPPRGSKAQARIMACERSQFAADGGLVEHEKNDGEFGFVAKAVEQGAECVNVVGRPRDVGAHVAACLLYTSPSPRDRQKS